MRSLVTAEIESNNVWVERDKRYIYINFDSDFGAIKARFSPANADALIEAIKEKMFEEP